MRPRSRPRILVVVGLMLLLLGAGTYLFVSWLANPTAPVAVTRITVSADTAIGHCPTADYRLTAHILTSGSGLVIFEWIQPNGIRSSRTTIEVVQSAPDNRQQFVFTYNGQGHAGGDAYLHVLSPVDLRSEPAHVEYLCP